MVIFYSLNKDKFYPINYNYKSYDFIINKFTFKLNNKINIKESKVQLLSGYLIFEFKKIENKIWSGIGRKLDILDKYIDNYKSDSGIIIIKQGTPYRDTNN